MTRTARAAYPRAVNKDRSESRSGLDTSMRKSGAGHHNWGSIADEQQLEAAALEDEGVSYDDNNPTANDMTASISSSASDPGQPAIVRSTSGSLSDEELEKARQFRKRALKKQGAIDLTAIARTSAAVRSPVSETSPTSESASYK